MNEWCFIGITFYNDKTEFRASILESSGTASRFQAYEATPVTELAPSTNRIIFMNIEGEISNLNLKPYGGILDSI
jgi:hypothetical protein